MHLSKYVFRRGNQNLVLQGMIHIGPEGLYRKHQEDLDNHLKEGYEVFFEGVRGYPNLQIKASACEREIARYFRIIFDLYPVFAAVWGFQLQRKNIRYPLDAVNADISFAEMVRLLKEGGFKCGFIVRIFEAALKDKGYREQLKDNLAKVDPFKKPRKGLSYFFTWLIILRKLVPVIIGYRNKVAVDIIERYSARENLQNIFVHYGEGHIPGMIKLLEGKGWRLVSLSRLDLAAFRAKVGA